MLQTEEKKELLTTTNVAKFRDVVRSSGILADVDGVVDGERKVPFSLPKKLGCAGKMES